VGDRADRRAVLLIFLPFVGLSQQYGYPPQYPQQGPWQ
jgi:hypothetical protein